MNQSIVGFNAIRLDPQTLLFWSPASPEPKQNETYEKLSQRPNLRIVMPSMPILVQLDVRCNKIGDAGAEKIAAALPNMPNLKDQF